VLEREKHYFDLLHPEYNIAEDPAASFLGRKHSPATLAKFALRRHSPETRILLGAARRGVKIPHTAETRAKIALSLLGNKRSLGKRLSEETKAKMSEAKLGNAYALGVKRSEETKSKISEARGGSRVKIIDHQNGTEK
jgi:hypothetical protein